MAPSTALGALTTRSQACEDYAEQAARIEMLQNGPHAGMQWILNSIPDVFEDDGLAWDGTETAQAWSDRVEAADKAAEADAMPVRQVLDKKPLQGGEGGKAHG